MAGRTLPYIWSQRGAPTREPFSPRGPDPGFVWEVGPAGVSESGVKPLCPWAAVSPPPRAPMDPQVCFLLSFHGGDSPRGFRNRLSRKLLLAGALIMSRSEGCPPDSAQESLLKRNSVPGREPET